MGHDAEPGGEQESKEPTRGPAATLRIFGAVVRDIRKLFNYAGWTVKDSESQWTEIKKLQGAGGGNGGVAGGGTIPDIIIVVNSVGYYADVSGRLKSQISDE